MFRKHGWWRHKIAYVGVSNCSFRLFLRIAFYSLSNLMSNILEYLRKNVCLGQCFECLIQIHAYVYSIYMCQYVKDHTHNVYTYNDTITHKYTVCWSFKVNMQATWPAFLNLETYHDSTDASQCGSDTNAMTSMTKCVWLASSLAMRKSVAPSDPRGHQSKSENQRTTDQDWQCLTHVSILHYASLCHVISFGVDMVVFLILEARLTSLSMRNVQIKLKMMDVCELTHLLGFQACHAWHCDICRYSLPPSLVYIASNAKSHKRCKRNA